MNNEVELALKIQRLQFKSAALRHALAGDIDGIAPAFRTVDQIRAGIDWLRTHPLLVAAVAMTIVVVRPKAAWRWARRGFLAWQTWRRFRPSDRD